MKYPNINHCWGALIVEELVRSNAEYFCVAPGSRSSPLAVAIARHDKAKTFVHFDERGLGFHACGYAAATGKPVVLVCTSGTAVANFLPAVIEASKKKIPLIALTADRPPELRQTGAVQTIDQPGIFGKYVVWQTDMPCPDMAIKAEFVLTTIDQALHQAMRRRGVVHINCMFREPLAPVETGTKWGKYFDGLKTWEKSGKPYTEYLSASGVLRAADAKKAATRINAIKNGIIVAGKLNGEEERNAVVQLARRLNWPIFADISSGLRLGYREQNLIHYFDQVLLSASRRNAIKVDGIIHVGGRITSKHYYEFIEEASPSEYIMVLNHALRNDPAHKVTLRLETSVANFCDSVGGSLKVRAANRQLTFLSKINQKFDQRIEKAFKNEERLTEPGTARLVSQLVPAQSGLFLANSMPIRDMDMYADFKGAIVHVSGNRGASGIDGTIASAAGYAQGLRAPVTLMVGDLAALHDLNSLAMLKDIKYPLIMVVLNNGGGGIFSFLPIAEQRDVFEKFFGTPHAFTFANAAAMFELQYAQPYNAKQFARAYTQAFKSGTSTIIEVITNREENVKIHRTVSPWISKK